jgi:hypothetical protein
MGYYATAEDFYETVIPVKDIRKLAASFSDAFAPLSSDSYFYPFPDHISNAELNNHELASVILRFLSHYGFSASFSNYGLNVYYFTGRWNSTSKDIINILGAFFPDGASIVFVGEENSMWKYEWWGGKFKKYEAEISWIESDY